MPVPRLPNIPREDCSPAQLALFDAIAGGTRLAMFGRDRLLNRDGSLQGPFNAMLQLPGLGNDLQRVGQSLRENGVLPARLREIAILVVAARYRADFEWFAHAPVALREGVSQQALDALRKEEDPGFEDVRDRAAWRFARLLLDGGRLDEAQYGQVCADLGKDGAVEIAINVGYYITLALILNAFEVALPEGAEPPFK